MSRKTVLLVDDSPEDSELMRRAFDQVGFAHETAAVQDGEEALAYLERERLPALVLLDLKMPRVGGLEFLGLARADPRLKSLRVVVLTSSDEDSDRLEAASLGVELYVVKPLDFSGYLELARRLGALLSDGSA